MPIAPRMVLPHIPELVRGSGCAQAAHENFRSVHGSTASLAGLVRCLARLPPGTDRWDFSEQSPSELVYGSRLAFPDSDHEKAPLLEARALSSVAAQILSELTLPPGAVVLWKRGAVAV